MKYERITPRTDILCKAGCGAIFYKFPEGGRPFVIECNAGKCRKMVRGNNPDEVEQDWKNTWLRKQQ